MPAKFLKCVSDLKAKGKSNDSAYAICTASYIESHGKSPFANEASITALPIQESTKRSITGMIESCGNGKKVRLKTEQTGQAV